MKKKAFTRFLYTSFSALICTAALAVTLSLTNLLPPENNKNADGEVITECPGDDGKNHISNTPATPSEPGIIPQGDWEEDVENLT